MGEIPVSFQVPGTGNQNVPDLTTIVLSERDIPEIKQEALRILQYAMPNSLEEAMANCLLEETPNIKEDLE